MTSATALPALDGSVWLRIEADEAAAGRRAAVLRDELATLERRIEELRAFRSMLAAYAQPPLDPGPADVPADAESRADLAPDADHAAGDRPGSPAAPDLPADGGASADEALRAALRERLPEWTAWIEKASAPGQPPPRRSDMAYAVTALCHCLDMLEAGLGRTEEEAVEWAQRRLPEPWRSTVERARAWRADTTVDEAATAEAREFVRWAVERAMSRASAA